MCELVYRRERKIRAGREKGRKPCPLSGMLSLAAAGMLVMACLTGCGGEYAGGEGDRTVSGGAISGGAVSEGAVDGKKVSASVGTYTYCNDRYVYYTDVDELIGRNIDTGKETAVKVKNIADVCYADNDWVYYTKVPASAEIWEEVWRIPVKKGEEWELDEQAKERLLREKEGFDSPEGALCDGRYIVYVTSETYRYRQYNIEKKAYENCESQEKWEDYCGGLILCGGSAFFHYGEGVARKRLDLDEAETVVKCESGELPVLVAATETELFFRRGIMDEQNETIWQYTLATGETKRIIDTSEIKAVLKEEGLLSCPVAEKHKHKFAENGMFVNGNRLYVQIYIHNDSGNESAPSCHNMAILSKEIGSSGELRYEKQLSGCLENPEKNRKVVKKGMPGSGIAFEIFYQSRGILVMMLENKCLMYVEDSEEKKNRWACYDLDTGKFQYITKKDREWYMAYYDRHHSMLEGWMEEDPVDLYPNDYTAILYMMPNNYDF